MRSLILFTLLFNQTPARISLTLWVAETLPNSIFLTVLIGCTCTEELPPLGSYYDFMDRFWMASCSIYSRHSLLPVGRYSKKPEKYWAAMVSWKIMNPRLPVKISWQTLWKAALRCRT